MMKSLGIVTSTLVLSLSMVGCSDDDDNTDLCKNASCGTSEVCVPATGDCVSDAFIDFEDLTLAADSYWTADATGVFSFASDDASFNQYSEPGSFYWEGFTYSNMTDTTTAGYLNQASPIPGSGVSGSTNFGVGYMGFMGTLPAIRFTGTPSGIPIAGAYVTNTTAAYLAMRDGDAYAKKFGGTSGADPDWFKLSVVGIDSTDATTGLVELYLADFRFADASDDYILDEWTWVDLSSLGTVVGLRFTLSSTDNGAYGINTPAYFAIDDIARFTD